MSLPLPASSQNSTKMTNHSSLMHTGVYIDCCKKLSINLNTIILRIRIGCRLFFVCQDGTGLCGFYVSAVIQGWDDSSEGRKNQHKNT